MQRLEKEHYRKIHRAIERALADGAFGVSLGLGYAPECFYETQELMEALAPLSNSGIPITVHMRQEGSGVEQALEEMIAVGKALRTPVEISHLKSIGRQTGAAQRQTCCAGWNWRARKVWRFTATHTPTRQARRS